MELPNGMPDPLLNHKSYRTRQFLGNGTSGFVVQALDLRSTPEAPVPDVAIKLLRRSEFNRYVESEILNHSTLRHPHVVQFRKVFLTDEYICIVMELASQGSLFKYVLREGRLGEDVARFFFQQLMIGVEYCHKRGVANRDIKLENALLHDMPGSPLPLLKICDFGFSKSDLRSAAKSAVGTLMYMAPEVLVSDHHYQYNGKIADIWSCGIMLYSMLYGKYPFDQKSGRGRDLLEMLENMVNMRFSMPTTVAITAECQHLLSGMLQPEPSRRITLEQILSHPWFQFNLPAEAAGMNSLYLQDRPDPKTDAAVAQIRRLLEQARRGASPRSAYDEHGEDVIESAIRNPQQPISQDLAQFMSTYRGRFSNV